MKSISVLVLFLVHNVVTIGVQPKWADYRSSYAISTHRFMGSQKLPVVCKEPGLTCGSDCVSVYLCKKTDNGFRAVLAETCRGDTTCSAGQCSTVPSHECSSGAKFPFVCRSRDGIYPDPADCRKYHYCVPDVNLTNIAKTYIRNLAHFEAYCDSNYAYNPRTTYCDILLPKGECYPNLVPVCQKPAQTGAILGNLSVYYICLPYSDESNILYPFLYICPRGQHYTGNYECEPPKTPTPTPS